MELTQGNLLEADVEALVNTVNCVGIMGKGIALQFKKAFPENYEAYRKACKAEEVRPGRMFIFRTGRLHNPKFIVNFPTKRHWKGKSRIEDIESGLRALVTDVRELQIRSIAVPPLGCGFGGLAWDEVRPLIAAAFATIPDVHVLLFEPKGAPKPSQQPDRTARPRLTLARALFLKLIERYGVLDYSCSLLELQKLAYFLQESGQRLRLPFVRHFYGPYADNLNKVLEKLEGHFTEGYDGDRKPGNVISLKEGAIAEADRFLSDKPDARSRLDRVSRLIEGFETPYSMELLSSVHWVAAREKPNAVDSEMAIQRIQEWNDRKKRLLKPRHVRIAWKQLDDCGWLNST